MNRFLPRTAVWLGGGLLVAASLLFWRIILTPDLARPGEHAVATVLLFVAGVLLIVLTPLVSNALASPDPQLQTRSKLQRDQPGTARSGKVARLLIWLILIEFVAIALLQ